MLEYRNARLHLDGRDLCALVEMIGSPAFVISERRLLDNRRALLDGLSVCGHDVLLRYCAKSNAETGVLSVMAAAGDAVMVSHADEADRAIRCGYPAAQVALQRPVLRRSEVREAMDLGVCRFHVYQAGDVEVLAECARSLGTTLKVSVRVATPHRGVHLVPQVFLASRLGLNPARCFDACRRIRETSSLELVGLNFHLGTQVHSANSYRAMLDRTAGLAARVERELGVTLREFNVGGGFPSGSLRTLSVIDRLRPVSVPMPDGGGPGALERFAAALARGVQAAWDRAGLKARPTLVAESGRGIVGNAGILLTTVHSAQGRWVYLDATRNWLAESPLLFARAHVPLRRPAGGRTRTVHLSGSTLNSMDVFDLFHALPASVGPGDALALCDAGAYTVARASRYASRAPRVHMLTMKGAVEPASDDAVRERQPEPRTGARRL